MRAAVQGDGPWWFMDEDARKIGSHPPGTISWTEHLEAYKAYSDKYGTQQTAKRINERGGFGYDELTALLGREPKTWLKS